MPYRLDTSPCASVVPPMLDASQQRVVDHPGGPLLVLAGPGTGKTTTLVEAVVERVRRGLPPDRVLVLTFSRKAADELRDRIGARLGRTVATPLAATFHSWCLALVAAYSGREGPPRLLSGAERLVRIRDLLEGSAEGEGRTRWPASLGPALRTQGMAREVADLLDRARERAVEPADLHALARSEHRADWAAAADFFVEYSDVLADRGEMDYAELVRRALGLLDDPVVRAEVAAGCVAVFVDEYQDTDPAQEALLQQLAGGGSDLVVVGDPDQAIYGFRGADVDCLLGFPDRFPTRAGLPAPTVSLAVSRRAGSDLLAASRCVARRLPAPGLPAARLRAHRELRPGGAAADDPGDLELRLFATASEEATGIADVLRRAHLEDGRRWREMAVLVRSGRRSIPLLRRALVAAGVPVATAADELPVARDPAVVPLLQALECADCDERLDEDSVRSLLGSPLVRATPADLRRLGRALRALEGETGDGVPVLPAPSAALLVETVRDPGRLTSVDQQVARPARRLADLLAAARQALAEGGAEQALWALWEGSGWPRRLSAASAGGGQAGRAADRDLDAVVALFDAVARTAERQPGSGVATLLAELRAQEIPSGSREEGVLAADGAVRLLTAHRSKGLEWELVVVAAVQEGSWPDLRRRFSLLGGDRLARDGVVPPPSAATLLADERRLFYVAVTRARRRLVVTAVRSLDDDGERPSRLVEELGLPLPETTERAAGLLSLPSLVGRLRRAVQDPETPDRDRAVAVAELARLAGRVPVAHPDAWWGLRELTAGAAPVHPGTGELRLSGSSVGAYDTCPLAWFLDHEVRAARPTTTAQGFGLVLHALARLVATGAVPSEVGPLLDRLDSVWGSLGFDAAWQGERERRQAEAALGRFLAWHLSRDRECVGAEADFEVPVAGVVLRGCLDRVERDADGRLVVVDLKTGGSPPSAAEVEEHAQLGVYQLAVRAGALTPALGPDNAPGGAELVHLRIGPKSGQPKVQRQAPLAPDGPDGTTWAERLVRSVAEGIAAESFPARPGAQCDRCAFSRACPARDEGRQVVA